MKLTKYNKLSILDQTTTWWTCNIVVVQVPTYNNDVCKYGTQNVWDAIKEDFMYTFPKKTHAQFNFCEYNKFHSIIIIKRADDSRGGVGYSYEVWLISLSLHLVLVSFLRINKIHMTLNFYKFPPMCYFLQGMINIMKMWNAEELKNLLYNICLAVFDFFIFVL